MKKRIKEYKLVRCEAETRKNRRIGLKCVLAGLMSLVLIVTAGPAFVFPRQSTVIAAQEPLDVSGGDLAAGPANGEQGAITQGHLNTQMGRVLFDNVLSQELSRENILIALDAGHGGEDEGTSRNNVLEKDINLEIAKAVEEQLVELGYQVLMTRKEDKQLTMEERVCIANEAGAHLYVSIHQNACEENRSDISGIEVWYNEEKAESGSRRLAQLIQNDVLLYTKAKKRELVADESLYVIRETQMPACLVETGFLSNPKESELLTTEEYQARIAEGIVSGIDLYFFPKTMYLTFDDGPSAENTERVLDILKEENVKATFFVIGENVEKHPEVAKRIVDEGHTIGIHCYNHDYDKLYQSADSYVADFEKAQEVVFRVTGVETRLFRFPGGSINSHNKAIYKEITEQMTENGYIYFDWNASLEDASRHNAPEIILKNARESTLGRRKVVMLAHDVVTNTAMSLDELIEQFPEYRMEKLDETVDPIVF